MRYAFAMTFVAALATFGSLPSPAAANDAQVARGRYLVTLPFLTNWRVWAFL